MHAYHSSSASRSSRTGGSVWNKVRTAFQVMRERRALAAMGADQLADLGLSDADVMRETGRPMWDLPRGR